MLLPATGVYPHGFIKVLHAGSLLHGFEQSVIGTTTKVPLPVVIQLTVDDSVIAQTKPTVVAGPGQYSWSLRQPFTIPHTQTYGIRYVVVDNEGRILFPVTHQPAD